MAFGGEDGGQAGGLGDGWLNVGVRRKHAPGIEAPGAGSKAACRRFARRQPFPVQMREPSPAAQMCCHPHLG
jgi:hypothetical protein